ncbi:MAG TPA: hypothetical protein VK212_00445 [Lentimicrobium sp.]|nr:hypothetical protein [Lentimicrobium sp.]
MKNIIALSIFVLFYFNIQAQEESRKNGLRFGYNISWFGSRHSSLYLYGYDVIVSGDSEPLTGGTVYLGYSYQFIPVLAIGSQIYTGKGSHYSDYRGKRMYTHNSNFAAGISVRVTPLPRLFNRFSFDAGILYQQINTMFNSKSFFTDEFYNHYENFGIGGSINLDIIKSKKIESGLRFELMSGFYDGKIKLDSKHAGIYIGARF